MTVPETASGTINLYAVCSSNIYTITLDNQSATSAGTGTIYEAYGVGYSLTSGGSATTTITKPTKTNYTFGGYYTGTNGSGTQIINASGTIVGSTTAFSSATTLYAYWLSNYTVTISCTNCSSNPSSKSIAYNSSGTFTITASSGYTLTGATVSGTGCSLSGSTLTASNVTSARTCSVTAKSAWTCATGDPEIINNIPACVTNASLKSKCVTSNNTCTFEAMTYYYCLPSGDSQKSLSASSGVGATKDSTYGCYINSTSVGYYLEFSYDTAHCNGTSPCYEYLNDGSSYRKYTKVSTCTQSSCSWSYCGTSGTNPKDTVTWREELYQCQRKYNQGQCGESIQEGQLICTTSTNFYQCASGWTGYPGNSAKCYQKAKYTVNVTCNNCSSSPTSRQVEHGSSTTFTITENNGYILTGATVTGTGCSLNESTGVLTVSGVTGNTTCVVSPKAGCYQTVTISGAGTYCCSKAAITAAGKASSNAGQSCSSSCQGESCGNACSEAAQSAYNSTIKSQCTKK